MASLGKNSQSISFASLKGCVTQARAQVATFFLNLRDQHSWVTITLRAHWNCESSVASDKREQVADKAARELMCRIENSDEQPLAKQTYRRQLKALIYDEYCPLRIRARVLRRHSYLLS